MLISELIEELEKVMEDEGNLPVVAYNPTEECVDASKVEVGIRMWAYHGKHKGNVVIIV